MMATTLPPIILGTSQRAPPPPRGSDGRGRPRAVAAGGGRRWPGGEAWTRRRLCRCGSGGRSCRRVPLARLLRFCSAGRPRLEGARRCRRAGRPSSGQPVERESVEAGGWATGREGRAGRGMPSPCRPLAGRARPCLSGRKAPPCSQPRRGRAGAPGRVPAGRRTPPSPSCSGSGGAYGLATAVGMAACKCRPGGLPLAPPPPTRRRSRLYREGGIRPSL